MEQVTIFPVVVQVPTSELLTGQIQVSLEPYVAPVPLTTEELAVPRPVDGQVLTLVGASGFLGSLVSGAFSIALKRVSDGTTFGAINWNVSGAKNARLKRVRFDQSPDGVRVDVIGLGVGAANCTVVLWLTGDL